MASKSNSDRIKENVIHAVHILMNRGICEAFGHVSARLPETDLFVITPKACMDNGPGHLS